MKYENGERMYFGDRVNMEGYLIRNRNYDGVTTKVWWEPKARKVTRCIVIGFRRLSDGVVGVDGYKAREHFDVVLVAYNPRRAPVYVLPENLEKMK
jgi:hypothetical protein